MRLALVLALLCAVALSVDVVDEQQQQMTEEQYARRIETIGGSTGTAVTVLIDCGAHEYGLKQCEAWYATLYDFGPPEPVHLRVTFVFGRTLSEWFEHDGALFKELLAGEDTPNMLISIIDPALVPPGQSKGIISFPFQVRRNMTPATLTSLQRVANFLCCGAMSSKRHCDPANQVYTSDLVDMAYEELDTPLAFSVYNIKPLMRFLLHMNLLKFNELAMFAEAREDKTHLY